VPSALTYRVRQIEDALDVLLFDRSVAPGPLTAAGAELLREGDRLLLRGSTPWPTASSAWPPAGSRSSPSPWTASLHAPP
jgi:DNA-binding transcriptional LysR family regulator